MRSSEILINSWHNNKFWCSYRSSSLQPFKPSSHQAVKNLGDRTSPHGFMITGWWCNNHPEDMKVNGKDDIPYMKWKIKFMFETTNQMIYAFVLALLYLWEESLAAQCWTCPQYSICPLAWDVGGNLTIPPTWGTLSQTQAIYSKTLHSKTQYVYILASCAQSLNMFT